MVGGPRASTTTTASIRGIKGGFSASTNTNGLKHTTQIRLATIKTKMFSQRSSKERPNTGRARGKRIKPVPQNNRNHDSCYTYYNTARSPRRCACEIIV